MPSLEDPYAILDSNTDPELLYNQSAADGNPLKGFLTSDAWAAWPYRQDVRSSLEYYYIPLRRVLNASADDYAGFDSYLEPRLAASAARGMQAIFRFFLEYPGVCYHACAVPQFLLDGGLQFNAYTEFGGGLSPDYADEQLVSALEAFIATLGCTCRATRTFAGVSHANMQLTAQTRTVVRGAARGTTPTRASRTFSWACSASGASGTPTRTTAGSPRPRGSASLAPSPPRSTRRSCSCAILMTCLRLPTTPAPISVCTMTRLPTRCAARLT